MSNAGSQNARDNTKPVEYYLAYLARMEKYVDTAVEGANPGALVLASDYCIRMGRAAYSAGLSASKCDDYLKRSADFQIRFYAEGVQSKMTSLAAIEKYFEGFSAGYLAGSVAELISAFESVKPDRMHPWDRFLLNSLIAVLLGRPIAEDIEGEAAAAKMKEFAPLPSLLRAVERRDMSVFTQSLENYAVKIWGPPADRGARNALREAYPDYPGKWSFFCGAMCDVMGSIPNLSKKSTQYVPVDLVTR